MMIYRCDWPNGDVSFVLAEDEVDALFRLDEIGGAEEHMLTEQPEFMIDFEFDLTRVRKLVADVDALPSDLDDDVRAQRQARLVIAAKQEAMSVHLTDANEPLPIYDPHELLATMVQFGAPKETPAS
jgi:hypothetical protein